MENFFVTDQEIQDLINEPKFIDQSVSSMLEGMKSKAGRQASFSQHSIEFPRKNSEDIWQIYLRKNENNQLDFSCGIAFIPKDRNEHFSLKRYNGNSHLHTNRLETEQGFLGFHIHQATEKYQESSYKADHYAQPTDRYADLYQAFLCLLQDCQVTTDKRQQRLL